MKCESTAERDHLEAIMCCNDEDRCNNDENLPTLAPPPPEPGQ